MRRVVVENPFVGKVCLRRFDDDLGIEVCRRIETAANIHYARAAVRDAITRGEAPIASHLSLTQPEVLDGDVPEERNLGIEAGLIWQDVANAAVVYTDRGWSSGTEHGSIGPGAFAYPSKSVVCRTIGRRKPWCPGTPLNFNGRTSG